MTERIGYHGNPQLLTPNIVVSLTKKEQDEYIKCMMDPVHFIKNYTKIVQLGKGLVKFNLRDYQERMIRTVDGNRFTVGLWPRQYGKCFLQDTEITVKNKLTDEIETITVKDLKLRIEENGCRAQNAYSYGKNAEMNTSVQDFIPLNTNKMSNLSDTVERKFIKTYDIEDYEILTDTGWEDLSQLHITVEYQVYQLLLENGMFLECADTHIVFDSNLNEIFVKDLIPHNSYVMTDDGPVLVISVVPTDRYENMADMTIESENHRYYTNGILSHNSTTMCSYMLHQALFNEDFTIAIICDKKDLAKDLLGRIKLMYEHLPLFLKQAIVSWNKGDIEFLNGSKIKTFAAGGRGVAGQSVDLLYLDEFAHVPANQAEAFYAGAYPVISSSDTSRIIITSTPAGKNMFYDFWEGATHNSNEYVPVKVDWWEMPGRDEKWKQRQLKNMTEQQFNVEFSCQFLGSTNILIDSFKLSEMKRNVLKPVIRENDFDIYEIPQKDHGYVITVDVAEGQNKDYSAFSVTDVTSIPYRQVAKFRSKTITPVLYPTVIFNVARKYNDAYVLVEINSIGHQVANILYNDFSYENIIRVNPRSPTGGPGQYATFFFQKGSQLGLKTSTSTKRIGCANLKTLVETDKLIINDLDTILELETFAVNKTSYAAEANKHDDLVMSLVLFSWLAAQKEFVNFLDSDIRKFLEDETINVNDRPFRVYIDDGVKAKIDPYNLDWKQDYNKALEDGGLEIDRDGDIWVPVNDFNDSWKYRI